MTRLEVTPGLIIAMADAAELMTMFSKSEKKEHKIWVNRLSKMVDSIHKANELIKQQEEFILFIKKNNEKTLWKLSEVTNELEEYKQSERL